ncbi:MAG: flagellar hook assembly protein FlgD [Christensenellales bacterium]|jgi:flagellar basal-body rod modification protein FlgD
MSTNSVSPLVMQALHGNGSAATAAPKKKSLDMNDFLKLFVTQMTYQDPLNSASDSSPASYMTQLAQITILEQLSQIGNSISASQAYGMIGKYVYIGSDSNLMLGRVDGVINRGGTSYLMVGGETYSMADVYAAVDGSAVGSATDDEVLKSAALIGRNVTAIVTDESGNESTVSGKVEKILVNDGVIYLVVGGQNVLPGSIVEISDSAAGTFEPEPSPEGQQV